MLNDEWQTGHPMSVHHSSFLIQHFCPSPVVQRRRLLVHIQGTVVRVHPGLLAQVRQLAERPGLNPGGCGFDSHLEHSESRLGRQLADHSRLEREMLWVRVPLELLIISIANALRSVAVGATVLSCLSSWSSQECSSPCQGEDRGFKSHRGRWQKGRRLKAEV
jgi:hypothetical protein